MSTVKISEATTVDVLTQSYKMALGNVGSSSYAVTMTNVAGYVASRVGEVMVVTYTTTSDQYNSTVYPPKVCTWDYYNSNYSSYTPVGVAIWDGTKWLVIALEETSLYWHSSGTLGGTAVSAFRSVITDFDGESKTAAIVSAFGTEDDSTYAPGYCYNYSAYSNNLGIPAGTWWLPSVGELYAISAKLYAINWTLNALGATQLTVGGYYWSSTEDNAGYAFRVHMGFGHVLAATKASASNRVRPVAALVGGTAVS